MKQTLPTAPGEQMQASAASLPVHKSLLQKPAHTQKIMLQKKLSIGAVNDPMEHEADAMADKVMRMPESNVIHRKCSHCEEDEKIQTKPLQSFIQKKETDGNSSVSNAVTNQIQATSGNGNRMNETTKSFMESRFGADFSNVNIHTGNYASQLAKQLHAQAFTVSNNIYFNDGKYAPESAEGKHLLAHELTHTIQQRSNTISPKIQRVELTYDDGPDANTQTTLSAVNAGGAKATFYLVGQKIQRGDNWKIVFEIAASGNWLGNHAFDWNFDKEDHIFMSGDFAERASKILQTEFAIRDALIKGKADAQKNKKWELVPEVNRRYIDDVISSGTGRFRTPGFRSHWYSPGGGEQKSAIDIVNKILQDAGLRPYVVSDSVTIDPKDWAKGKTQSDVEHSVTGDLSKDSDLILLHSRLGISAAATPAILNAIKNKGFSYQEPSRGVATTSAGSGFSGVKTTSGWVNSYYWIDKIAPSITVSKTDPFDRTVTTQTGVAWIDYGSSTYLAIISIENSSISPGSKIYFLSFIDQDLKDKAIARAAPNQPKGIQTLAKQYIIDAPDSITAGTAKK